jgi:conjugative transfer region protein TrbK
MTGRVTSEKLLTTGAVALTVLVVAACAIQLRPDGGERPISHALPSLSEPADSFAADLEQCRTVTSEQAAELERCRTVWAESRRRFLTSTQPNWSTSRVEKPVAKPPATKSLDPVSRPPLNREPGAIR